MTILEAGELAAVTRERVRQWIQTGRIKAEVIGTEYNYSTRRRGPKYDIDRESLVAFLARRKR